MNTSAQLRRPRRSAVGLLVLVAGFVLAGCASVVPSPDSLIDAPQLLSTSGVATRAVTSAHFTIKVRGHLTGLSIRDAEGDLDAHGAAKGTATTVSATGTPTKVGFVLAKGEFYLQEANSGYRKVDPAVAPGLFGLTTLLNPNHGLAHMVQTVDRPKTQDIEPMDGIQCFRVTGTTQQGAMMLLTPGLRSPSIGTTLWLARDRGHLPVRAELTVPRSAGGGTVDFTITDVNTPISVTAPV